MSEVTFKIDTHASRESIVAHRRAIDIFFSGLLMQPISEGVEPASAVKKAPVKKAAPAKKAFGKKTAPAKQEQSDELTLEEMSSRVAAKVQAMKEAGQSLAPIAKQLKSLGTSKLDELEEEKYEEFLTYVEGL